MNMENMLKMKSSRLSNDDVIVYVTNRYWRTLVPIADGVYHVWGKIESLYVKRTGSA
jgi:hypothetical protein